MFMRCFRCQRGSRRWFVPFWFALYLIVASCAASPPKAPDQAAVTQVRVEALDNALRRVDSGMGSKSLSAVFPLIQGALYGAPTMESVFLAPARFGEDFSLNVLLVEAKVKPFAAPLTARSSSSGLAIDPASTKLVRLGTFLHDAQTGEWVSGAGFYVPPSLDNLVLVYFDRACRISGTFKSSVGDLIHDVTIPAAGMHWLRTTRIASNTLSVRVDPHPPVVLLAAPVSSLRGQ
jgi:hypothetical protein